MNGVRRLCTCRVSVVELVVFFGMRVLVSAWAGVCISPLNPLNDLVLPLAMSMLRKVGSREGPSLEMID